MEKIKFYRIHLERINFKMKMNTDNSNDQLSSRGFLRARSAALAGAVGALSGSSAIAQNQDKSQNATGDRTKSDPGPANPAVDGQNPDSIWPLSTDSKSLVQNFKSVFFRQQARLRKAAGTAKSPFANCPSPKL
jgi:hypothetical protein